MRGLVAVGLLLLALAWGGVCDRPKRPIKWNSRRLSKNELAEVGTAILINRTTHLSPLSLIVDWHRLGGSVWYTI